MEGIVYKYILPFGCLLFGFVVDFFMFLIKNCVACETR